MNFTLLFGFNAHRSTQCRICITADVTSREDLVVIGVSLERADICEGSAERGEHFFILTVFTVCPVNDIFDRIVYRCPLELGIT